MTAPNVDTVPSVRTYLHENLNTEVLRLRVSEDSINLNTVVSDILGVPVVDVTEEMTQVAHDLDLDLEDSYEIVEFDDGTGLHGYPVVHFCYPNLVSEHFSRFLS